MVVVAGYWSKVPPNTWRSFSTVSSIGSSGMSQPEVVAKSPMVIVPLSAVIAAMVPTMPPAERSSAGFCTITKYVRLPSSPSSCGSKLMRPSYSPSIESTVLSAAFSVSSTVATLATLGVGTLLSLVSCCEISLCACLTISGISIRALTSTEPFFREKPCNRLDRFSKSVNGPLTSVSTEASISRAAVMSLPNREWSRKKSHCGPFSSALRSLVALTSSWEMSDRLLSLPQPSAELARLSADVSTRCASMAILETDAA